METVYLRDVIKARHMTRRSVPRCILTKKRVIMQLLESGLSARDIICDHGFSSGYVYRLRCDHGYTSGRNRSEREKKERKRILRADQGPVTLALQLTGRMQQRYLQVVAYREYCRENDVEWSGSGLKRFCRNRMVAGPKKQAPLSGVNSPCSDSGSGSVEQI